MNVTSQSVTSSAPWLLGRGQFFMLIDTSAACTVEFFRNGTSIATATNVQAGYKATFNEPFDNVKITSSTTQTITVGISIDAIGGYDRNIGEVDATIVTGTGFTAVADVALTATTARQLVAADSTVKEVHVQATVNCRLGDVTNKPSASAGILLTAGMNAVIPCSGELWIYPVSNGTAYVSKVVV